MSETFVAYIPSPLWGEGWVRGEVCESPRDFARGLRRRQTNAERRADYDTGRTALLKGLGYRVLRFWDDEALANTDGVLQRIAQALSSAQTRPSPRPSPQRGEGEGRRTLAPEGERVG
jgi:hypothetical protein